MKFIEGELPQFQAFTHARDVLAYIEEFGVGAWEATQREHLKDIDARKRVALLPVLLHLMIKSPLWLSGGRWRKPEHKEYKSNALYRCVELHDRDSDLLPTGRRHYHDRHSNVAMLAHSVLISLLEELQRARGEEEKRKAPDHEEQEVRQRMKRIADVMKTWLYEVLEFFLSDDAQAGRSACTTCAQAAIDTFDTPEEPVGMPTCPDSYAATAEEFALGIWSYTRPARSTESDEKVHRYCADNDQMLATYLQDPHHRSVLQRLIELGIAEPRALEATV